VLAATDLDPSSDPAIESAARLADAAGAKLHIAHVIASDQTGTQSPVSSSDTSAQMAATLGRLGLSVKEGRVHIESGTPANVLSLLSDQIKADVIVIGRHRARTDLPAERPVGSTAYSIITRTLSPCLVTSLPLRLPLRRALVAIDASEAARGALLVALSWSSALRSQKAKGPEPTLTALHVESGETRSAADAHMKRTVDHELDVLRRSAGSWAGVSVEGASETNADPVEAIAKYATDQEADLVVLGTRGLSADLAQRLGSVSAAVTRRLQLPVLLVPPSVWRDFARDIDYF